MKLFGYKSCPGEVFRFAEFIIDVSYKINSLVYKKKKKNKSHFEISEA